jgi:POT family proton-dependent oligopeptide transporter
MQTTEMEARPAGEFLGHPRGLYLLFATEMWERFSFYGMRALLVLSLIAATDAANPGFGWSKGDALRLYGWYTGLFYCTALLGGWLADRYLGQRRAVMIGGVIMALGQFTLAWGIHPGDASLPVFLTGLALMIAGNGFFKPSISTMVGELYPRGDARRDGGFTIFYMGINLGAFIAPLLCSTLGEDSRYGWSYGYLCAGFGMIISVIIQWTLASRYLGDIGKQPSAQRALVLAGGVHSPLTPEERDRLRVIFTLFIFVVMFWAALEQAGGSMNVFAASQTDRHLGGFEIPAGWFQSLGPVFIILLAPAFSALWSALAARGRNPAAPVKMALGLLLTGAGFLFMVAAAAQRDTSSAHLASLWWLVLAYLFHTLGELCISPVGLSLMSKLAPLRLASLVMGVWFLIYFVANLLAGYVGAFAEQFGEGHIFAAIAATLAVFAMILWAISGRLVQWMHGAEKPTR